MMQDRKALQAGTSHYLGQNFSKASNIRFSNQEGQTEYAYTTSWGSTTRMIGALIMCHGDDDGLRLPPRIAPKQVVILPIAPKPEMEASVLRYAEEVAGRLRTFNCFDQPISVHVDKRDKRGGEKNWEWIKKGVPIRIEVGPRDLDSQSVTLCRRDRPHKEKSQASVEKLGLEVTVALEEIQKGYFEQARSFRDANIRRDLCTFNELKQFFTPKNADKPETHGGFVLAKWCGEAESEKMLEEMKVSIRCLPLQQSGTEGTCILTGRKATLDAVFAKSY
jgi:prolyl-tRNA synthetase